MDDKQTDKEKFVEQFRNRTKALALEAIKVHQTLPSTEESKIIGRQFLRSATSVAANYRAACRARSKAEFFAKLSITIEEADETLFWMEILVESSIVKEMILTKMMKEIVSVLAVARKNTYK